MRGFFAVTDPDWLSTLAAGGASEVNFWQPRPTKVRDVEGTPWIFKLRGSDRVAGYGFFSYWTEMPLMIAWETFGVANGVASMAEMGRRVRALRRDDGRDDRVGCVVLSGVTILPPELRPAAPADFQSNTVRGAGFDLTLGDPKRAWDQLLALSAPTPFASPIISVPGGYHDPAFAKARRGQGAFRLMVMDSYDRRCAITGERTLPVLEAAHIKPFAGEQTHEVANGKLMRSDLHRLYDRGLVTVDEHLTFHVSSSIERDYSNGKIYYALEGRTIATPDRQSAKPNVDALAWHSREIFRP